MFIVLLSVVLVGMFAIGCAAPPRPTSVSEVQIAAGCRLPEPTETPLPVEPTPTVPPTEETSIINLTVEIEGKQIPLVKGLSELESAPGSATKIITRLFGNEAFADLNGDGKEDVVFLITQDPGGARRSTMSLRPCAMTRAIQEPTGSCWVTALPPVDCDPGWPDHCQLCRPQGGRADDRGRSVGVL